MVAEGFPVFGQFNRIQVHADRFDIVFFPDALFPGLDGQVERGLPAHGRQDSIDLPFLQDLPDAFHGEGQQVYMVGSHRVGHDGGRVGIDEAYLDPFFTK